MTVYVLLDIGCLECGIDTKVLAITTDKSLMLIKVNEVIGQAEEIADAAVHLWKLEDITDQPGQGTLIGLVRSSGDYKIELHAHQMIQGRG